MNERQIPLATQVVTAIRSVIGSREAPLHEPSFQGNEWNYLKACLDSTFVSSVGKFVDQFEAELSDYTGAKSVVAVSSGTAALHIALKLAGVGRDDEVLVPALTFVATANAVTYCGAIPHFVDVEVNSLGIDPEQLRDHLARCSELRAGVCVNRSTGRVIRAVVPMHTFGHPVDMSSLLAVAHDYGLEVVEDASESLGSYCQGKHTGTFGRLGTLSFNGNKVITTGGGGAIITNDVALGRRAKHLTTTAKIPHPWEYRHDEIGYNYRLPNINAALGCAQLERLPDLLHAKRDLYGKYSQAFASIEGIRLVSEPNQCTSNYWLQTLVLAAEHEVHRDEILEKTGQAGYMTRPAWTLMDELLPFQGCPSSDLSVSRSLSRRIINIPSSPTLGNSAT